MSLEALGAELRSAREGRGIPLTRVAEETRISRGHLENLERGNFGALPGGMYNRAFLRSYCEAVGLDAGLFLGRYADAAAPAHEKPVRKPVGRPQPGRRPPASPAVIWSLLLVGSAAGAYLSRPWIGAVFSPYFRRPAAEAVHSLPVPEPAPPREAPKAEPVTVAVSAPAAATVIDAGPSRTEAPAAIPGAGASIRLEFQVLAQCWVSVTSDGNRVLVKLLEPGDDLSFEASDRFYVKLGNAGGVRVKLNGRPARALGVPGEVVAVIIHRENLDEFLEAAQR
jgi:cytoskeleton protein RodZ